MTSWFWGEPCERQARRPPREAAAETLMLEFGRQLREAERQQRERDSAFRRLQTGVDYGWLATPRRCSFSLSTGQRLGLEDLCCTVPPAQCGLVLLRIREALAAHQPDVQEVLGVFRGVLLEELDRAREEEETRRLTRQWNQRRSVSMSLVGFRSRIKINPFTSSSSSASLSCSSAGLASSSPDAEDLRTVSEDVERGPEAGGRRGPGGWRLPDF